MLLQQTPREVIDAAPSLAMLPPQVAAVWDIDVILLVVTHVGRVTDKVLNEIEVPYAVPTLFVA